MATVSSSLTSGFATVLQDATSSVAKTGPTSYADLAGGTGLGMNAATTGEPGAAAAAAGGAEPPAAAPATFDPTVLHTRFSDPMREVIRFLDTVSRVPSTTPAPQIGSTFFELWSVTGSPGTVADMQACLSRLYALTEPQLVGVLARVDPRARAHFHAQVQLLADAVHGDMDELSQAAALVRWLLGRGLPALAHAGLPEDGELHTSTVLKQRFATVEAMCRVARPDESNPAVAAAGATAAAAAKAAKAAQDALADTNDALAAADARISKQRTATIVLGVLLVVLAVAVVVLVVLLVRKRQRVAPAAISAGGVHRVTAPALPAGPVPPTSMFSPPPLPTMMMTGLRDYYTASQAAGPYVPSAFDAAMAAAVGGTAAAVPMPTTTAPPVVSDDFGFPSLSA